MDNLKECNNCGKVLGPKYYASNFSNFCLNCQHSYARPKRKSTSTKYDDKKEPYLKNVGNSTTFLCHRCRKRKPLNEFSGTIIKYYTCNECKLSIKQNEPYKQNKAIYSGLFEKQAGKCAICARPASELTKRLSIDHDHVSKKVRGLLCGNCNTGLGMFKDNIEHLKAAIEYLTVRI
jgi:hypothetical protein